MTKDNTLLFPSYSRSMMKVTLNTINLLLLLEVHCSQTWLVTFSNNITSSRIRHEVITNVARQNHDWCHYQQVKCYSEPLTHLRIEMHRILWIVLTHTGEYGLIKMAKLHSYTVLLISRLTKLHPCSDNLLYSTVNKW